MSRTPCWRRSTSSANAACGLQASVRESATLAELATLAGEIYREDLENGYVTVLGEMVAGAVSDPALGREVAARIKPWLEMVEGKVGSLVAGRSSSR